MFQYDRNGNKVPMNKVVEGYAAAPASDDKKKKKKNVWLWVLVAVAVLLVIVVGVVFWRKSRDNSGSAVSVAPAGFAKHRFGFRFY